MMENNIKYKPYADAIGKWDVVVYSGLKTEREWLLRFCQEEEMKPTTEYLLSKDDTKLIPSPYAK